MFWIGLIIGLIVGANISLILYACIIVGKESDSRCERWRDTKNRYYAVIPATVLFNERLKPNEKLLYALITALSNKEGYCYASNKYLGEKLGVDPVTVSRWITDLRRNNYVFVDIMRNEKKEIICRRIFPNDVPYRLNNQYPYILKNQEGIDEKVKDNNIIDNNINTHTVRKEKFNENVFLYDYEYKKLLEEYGENKTKKCIEELSLYKKTKGVEYESDYATIKRWVIIRVEELEARKEKKDTKKKSFNNYEQREYPKEFLDSLYENNNFTSANTEEDEMDLDM